MKGLMKRSAAIAAATALSVSAVLAADAFGGTTKSPTPVNKNDTALYWVAKLGSGWAAAPGVPTVVGDDLVVTSGSKLRKINKETGEVLSAEGQMEKSTSYGITAPLYADGKIFVSEGGGIVQAFDADTLESLWVYHDPLGGQSNSEIIYSDGYIYTGFWNSETKDANFVCLPVADTDPEQTNEEQAVAWTYAAAGGYYWAGAYATADAIIVGTDNGLGNGDGEGSSILVFDKQGSVENKAATILSEASGLKGDLRSAVSYDAETGYYFITSKAKLVYRFKLSDDNKVTDLEELDLGGMSTSTPIAANGRGYVGVCGGGQVSQYSGHHIAVIDAESFKVVYTLETDGYCQSSALVKDDNGENYVYFTSNYTPGKVYAFHDNKDMTEPEKTETVTENGKTHENVCPILFTPVGGQAQYCLTSLFADEDGTLYFKNDSGYVMALGSRVDKLTATGTKIYKEGELFDEKSLKVTATLANGVEKDVTARADYDFSEPLTTDDTEVSVSFDGMLYGDTDDETGHEYAPLYADIDITVLAEADYDALKAAEKAIDDIGEVTLESGDAIKAAREAYDALSEDLQKLVSNAEDLIDAETAYKKLQDDASSEEDSSSAADSSDADSSSAADTSSDTDTSSVNSSAADTSSAASSEGSSSAASSGAASSSAASSGASSSSSTSSAADNTNPATGGAAALSAVMILAGAAITVFKKNK